MITVLVIIYLAGWFAVFVSINAVIYLSWPRGWQWEAQSQAIVYALKIAAIWPAHMVFRYVRWHVEMWKTAIESPHVAAILEKR